MSYKVSYYTIFSNPVDEFCNRIVFSSRTSRTMKISRVCYDFLQSDLIEHIPAAITEKLSEHKIIVDKNENELAAIIQENKAFIDGDNMSDVLYEVIQPTAFCQLGCYYCGQQHTKTNLSEDLTEKIAERIYSKFIHGNYKSIYIGWFGGEPLIGLPQMRMINKKLRSFFIDKDVQITGKIVTNGLSLKENIFLELVNDFKIKQIEVTLDGTAEFHDSHRYTKAAGKSFDLIYANLKKILNREDYQSYRCNMNIRCNVDDKNIDGVVPLIRLLAEDGLHKKVSLYFIAIYSWAGNEAHKKSLTKEEFAKLELEWYVEKTLLGYHTTHAMPSRKKQTCIAVGGGSEMYDAYGNIFNCTEVSYTDFYTDTPYTLGNLKKQHLLDFKNKPLNNWNQEILDGTQVPCHNCRLLPVCGGSCPKSWKEGHVPCPPFKYNLKKELELRYVIKRSTADELPVKLNAFVDALDINDFARMY